MSLWVTLSPVSIAYLKGVVLGECDNLEHFADAREDLVNDVQRDGIHHVLDDNSEDGVGAAAGRLVAAAASGPGLPARTLAGERLRGLGFNSVMSLVRGLGPAFVILKTSKKRNCSPRPMRPFKMSLHANQLT